MYRYKMASGSGKAGVVIVLILVGALLLALSGLFRDGGEDLISATPEATVPTATQADSTTLERLWQGVKVTAARLWGQVTTLGTKQVELDLGSSPNGAGDDEPDPENVEDVQVEQLNLLEPTSFVPAGATPQILIYHTHTYEAYTKTAGQNYTETTEWRTKDNNYNVVRVGEELARQLYSRYGIAVLHDKTDNEYPQLGTAYSRSLKMLEKDMAANKDLKILIDLHRDAYNTGIDPNAVTINGVKVARVMMVIGNGQGQTGVGFSVRPDWQKNLALANSIVERLNEFDPNLTRKTSMKTGRYNQHVSTGAILIEVGNNKNTLDEALAAVPFLAQAIAEAYEDLPALATQSASAPASSKSPAAQATPVEITLDPVSSALPTATATPASSPITSTGPTAGASPPPSPSPPAQSPSTHP